MMSVVEPDVALGGYYDKGDSAKSVAPRDYAALQRDLAADYKKIKAMNDWLRNFSKQRGLAFCDFHTAAVAADGRLRAELSDDGKHPNAAGYRQLAPAAQACILMATGGR